jgi:cobaltochelatase CobS
MKDTYIMKQNYLGIPKGTVLEVEEDTVKFVTCKYKGKKKVIPKSFAEPTGGKPATPTGTPTAAPTGTTMSGDDADSLEAALGFGATDDAFAEKPEEVKKKAPVKLEENQILLTSITGRRLPGTKIDHVITKPDPSVYPEGYEVDVPAIDPDFRWNPDVLEALWLAYKRNQKLLLTGPPGTGKTTAVEQFCAHLGIPRIRFNGKDGIEGSSFLGYVWATKEGMEWKDGMLPQGVRNGYMVLIDEVMKIPAGINMAMQSLYEKDGYLVLDDKPGTPEEKIVRPHPNFRMFMTDNVKGTGDQFDKFSATQIQDTSTLDRYAITQEVPYMKKRDEVQMLKKKFEECDDRVINQLVTFANLVRNGYMQSELSVTLSPRGLQTMLELYEDIPQIGRCIELAYLFKLGEADETDAVKEMIKSAF